MYKAYSVGMEQKDFELIRKIAAVITSEHIIIKDLRYYDVKKEDIKDDIIFAFGETTSERLKDIPTKATLFLPEVHLLHAKTGSEQKRQQTLEKLNDLKNEIKKETPSTKNETIKNDPVPNITLDDLKILENNLSKKNISNWLITTDTGKTINISINPEKSQSDINITFSELYTLKIAMEVMDIKEFMIVQLMK